MSGKINISDIELNLNPVWKIKYWLLLSFVF